MYVEVSESADRKQWNSLVKSVPEGTISQTTCWAEYMEENSGVMPLYLIAKNENNDIVGLLLLLKSSMTTSGILYKLSKFILPTYFWHYGPLIFNKENEKLILTKFLEKINNLAIKDHCYVIGEVYPPIHGALSQEMIKENFIRSGFQATKGATFLVNLTQDESVLWANVKKTARKNVKRCEKQGVTVEQIESQSELKDYYELLVETRKRMGFALPPSYPNAIMWKHLRNNNNVEVFMAKQNGRSIAGLGIVLFNGVLTEIGVAQSDYSIENKIYANDIIKWEIIKWGYEMGHKIYDLGGVSVEPRTEKEEGIYQFKAKWGGELVNFYKYSLTMGKRRKNIINLLRYIRNRIGERI